jgi:hypothetical protein
MTTYKGINGFAVQSVATDPSPLNEGQVWYNNATYAFKIAARSSGTWASGGSLSTARGMSFSAGTQTATMISAGSPVTGGLGTTQTELYNGSSWTTSGAYPAIVESGVGFGTQTAALSATGWLNPGGTPISAKFNGSTWTAGNSVNTARRYVNGFGTQTAAIIAGGYSPNSSAVESYNGTSWTSITSLPAVRGAGNGLGIQTAGILFGDIMANPVGSVLLYNGTAWTSATSMNTARYVQGGSGTQTAAVQFNGYTGTTTSIATEEWNGTSWFNSGNTANSKAYGMGSPSGTQTSALSIGGLGPALTTVATTEAYSGTSNPVTKTITTS